MSAVFHDEIQAAAEKHTFLLAPAQWTYYIVFPISLFQITWLIYVTTTIFRVTKEDEGNMYVYQTGVVTAGIYWSFMSSNFLLVAVMFLFDNGMIILSTVSLALSALALGLGMFSSYRSTYRYMEEFLKHGLSRDLWLVRGLLQNGVMTFMLTILIMFYFNFALILTEKCSVNAELSTCLVIGGFCLQLLIWFGLDVTVLDKYVRYTITPYFTAMYFITGETWNNFNVENHATVSVYLCCVSSIIYFMTVIKMILTIWAHREYPVQNLNSYDVSAVV